MSYLSCEKIVEVDSPHSAITELEAFKTKEEALSTVSGVYYRMINISGIPFMTAGGISFFNGMTSDEITLRSLSDATLNEFFTNNLNSANPNVLSYFWKPAYSTIYQINSVKEGLSKSTSLDEDFKKTHIAQLTVAGALIYFYLTELFGDIPYVTSSNWRENRLLFRTPYEQVLKNIKNELETALLNLPLNYNSSEDERIFPIKPTGEALLARINLFLNNFEEAEKYSTSIINNNLFELENLDDVFKNSSKEAIWQLKQSNSNYSSTPEGMFFVARNPNNPPSLLLQNSLLNDLLDIDARKSSWTRELIINNLSYTYPYKYKKGRTESVPGGNMEEYYIVLRLAEQYLIRAESRANLNKLELAIEDLNIIRRRAGLNDLPTNLSKEEILEAVLLERRIELMFEWGHRWFDLKRMKNGKEILSESKGYEISAQDFLFPIPELELSINPNLSQNPGY